MKSNAERRVYQQMASRIIEMDTESNARRAFDFQRLQQAISLVERTHGVDLANQRAELNRLMIAVQGQAQK